MGYGRRRARRGRGTTALVLAVIILSGGIFAWNAGILQPVLYQVSARLPQQIGATPTAPPSPPAHTTRDVALWPFQAHSPWNTPLATSVQFAGPGAACSRALDDPTYPDYLSTNTWSHAVFIASPTDSWATISYDPASHGPTAGVIATIRIPPNATPSPPAADQGGDARMYIIDPTHHFVDEMWKASKNPNGSWRVWSYRRNDLYGSGVGAGGVRAYGGSGLGGLIRAGELTHGIHHALAIAVPRAKEVNAWVWPAISNDVDGKPDPEYQGAIPMGQLVAIPPSVDVTRLALSAQGVVLAHALQDYGAYLTDSSSDYAYYGDTPVYHELNPRVNHGDLQEIQSFLQCVTNNGATAVGGGSPTAPRRAPWAPWLPGEPQHP